MRVTKTFKFSDREYLLSVRRNNKGEQRVALEINRVAGVTHWDPVATGTYNGLTVVWDPQFMLTLHMDLISAVENELFEMDNIHLI